jgi:von Willebrand factor type A domain
MLRFATILAVLTAVFVAGPVGADDKPAPVVDVVLCLDVSGSMNHLIDSARGKLWDIVNDLGAVKPTPRLRVGLYSYGHTTYDRNKGWVRKEVDLTDDLDTVYKKLNGLTINGGTEYVARVCRDAIVDQKWSADKKALKMIFVCGNEPADQDKEVTLESVAKLALDKDVIINTIYCTWPRAVPGEIDGWESFAKKAEGRFAKIDMKKGTVAIATPHDKKLEELSAKINKTYVAYGKKDIREFKASNQFEQDANAGKAPGAAPARALSKAGGLYRSSDWDLVDRLKDDPKLDITKIPEDELCDELKKLKPEERVAHVKKQLAEREAIQKEIVEVSKMRTAYIKEEMKKNDQLGDKAFDEAVRGALRNQANKKGFTIPE